MWRVSLWAGCSFVTSKPIAYSSMTLSSSEKNYSQIEKESLVITFAIKNFTNIYNYSN